MRCQIIEEFWRQKLLKSDTISQLIANNMSRCFFFCNTV